MAAEFANGHLAMMAIIGMFFHDGLTRSSWDDRLLYTASPLRALKNGSGVQDPVGFWDPVCVTSDRARAQPWFDACDQGYITLGIAGKLPGYYQVRGCAVRFGDQLQVAQNKLGTVPCLRCLLQALAAPAARHCGQHGGLWRQGALIKIPAEKQKKLAVKSANRRLAMMAIIGMFFQNGLTRVFGLIGCFTRHCL